MMLAVESMKHHTTDEGWQLAAGLESTGYTLAGYKLSIDECDIRKLLKRTYPGTLVVQDKREWDNASSNFRESKAQFYHIYDLKKYSDIFKVTVLKDSHQRLDYHRGSAQEMGVHAWIVYYDPDIVKKLAPYVRREHLIRTYHSLDADLVPQYTSKDRDGCLLSGAMSKAYPLRRKLHNSHKKYLGGNNCIPGLIYLPHPGYHRDGCCTPGYLKTLSQFKVVISTASRFQYALRRTFEATACGAIVITDLKEDVPVINDNLVRVLPNASYAQLKEIVLRLYQEYDPDKQERLATLAKQHYDYRVVGTRLARDIEQLRRNYK